MNQEPRYFDDVEAGDEIAPLVKEPTREQISAYLNVWGPLGRTGPGRFTDDAAARQEGLEGVIVPGNLSMAFLSQLLTDWAGERGQLRKLEVNFRRLIQPSDRLVCGGVVTDKELKEGEGQITADVFIDNQKGEKPIVGTALVILPTRPHH